MRTTAPQARPTHYSQVQTVPINSKSVLVLNNNPARRALIIQNLSSFAYAVINFGAPVPIQNDPSGYGISYAGGLQIPPGGLIGFSGDETPDNAIYAMSVFYPTSNDAMNTAEASFGSGGTLNLTEGT